MRVISAHVFNSATKPPRISSAKQQITATAENGGNGVTFGGLFSLLGSHVIQGCLRIIAPNFAICVVNNRLPVFFAKSCSLWECQFKSDYPYQVKKNALYCRAFFIFRYIQNNPQALPKLELIDYSFFNPNLFCLRTRDENSAISQK